MFVDSRVSALKKGQTMPVVKGFAPLILSFLGIANSSTRFFFQKGTRSIPTIQGFDPLVLPRFVLGRFGMPNPKSLEASLPGSLIIGLKMFSLAPNLQNQEELIIRMPKPFPFKDDYTVPWKYNMTLIST